MGKGSDGDPLSGSCHQWSWPGGKVPRYQSSAESNFLMVIMMTVVVMMKNVNMMMMIDNDDHDEDDDGDDDDKLLTIGCSNYSRQWFNC